MSRQKRILIVEDDVSLCLQISDVLYEFGFETGVAGDGAKALEILATCDPLPNLILLDLHMPNMNGWQLCEALKQNEKYSKIPVLIMSADEACLQMDAKDHLVKPFDLNVLLQKLQ